MSKEEVKKILAIADIKINGNRKWDIKVHNKGFYGRVLAEGNLGLGESYMEGWWDCDKIDEMMTRLLKSGAESKIKITPRLAFDFIKAKILNLQSKNRAFEVGRKHYDAGNDLYKLMLDKRMVYTCAYWKNAKTLDQAQEAKLDLVCRKLRLKPGQKILDIGCGWGSFLKFAAQKYKIKGVGITVSKEQVELAKELCKGLPIEIRLQDYRDLNEKFDHIVSLGMFEHVGVKNYREYFEVVNRCLKDNGLFLLHTIGKNESGHHGDPWFDKYIFPNGMIPSIKQIGKTIEKLFVMEDWHNFGTDYDKTLMEWFRNFDSNWNKIKSNYDERFYRMWKYYLLCCAGTFRAKRNQLWQIVLSKNNEFSYEPVR